MTTQLRYHHNSHSLLSAAQHYHNFSSPVNTKQTFNIHYGVQWILYRGGMKHFKPNLKYIACPCKFHTHTHTHINTYNVCVCVCVCVYMYMHVRIYTHNTHTYAFCFATLIFPAESPLQINTALQMISGAMCEKSILAAITLQNSNNKISVQHVQRWNFYE